MRTLDLLGVAAQAEGLHLQRRARGVIQRAVLAFAATLFGVAALVLLHLAGWMWLEPREGALAATLWLALADTLVALLLLLLARARTDRVAEEALMLRRRSLASLRSASRSSTAYEIGGAVAERLLRTLLQR